MSSDTPGHLVWRSRRGMKELDLILEGWLERRYAQASADERVQFGRFLELPDPEMASYLLGRCPPRDPSMAALVAQLLPGECPTRC